MITKLIHAVRSRATSWWRTRIPTRESIVVAALLALIFEVTYLAAFFVRGELLFRPSDANTILQTIGYVVVLKLLVFYVRGLCHRPWRAARFADLNNLLRANTTALLLLISYNYFGSFFTDSFVPIPRSVMLLDWAFTLLGVGGMQALARSLYEELMPATPAGKRVVLVVDASDEGRQLASDLGERHVPSYFVAGLLDDDPSHYGVHVGKARVLGPVSMASACAERLRVTDVVVREGAIYGPRLRALCDDCAAINVRVSIAERDASPASGKAGQRADAMMKVRSIELRDLLSRPQAKLADRDPVVLPLVRGKTILVTGAGGSIGGEVCRQVLRFQPGKVILVERAEQALFSIHSELCKIHDGDGCGIVPTLADVGNTDRMDRLLTEHKPEVIIHAAAFKHVPLMEGHPIEAIENNTLATASFADLADGHGVEVFVALSTDKAVHPSSVMGASKLVAERFLQSLGRVSKTRFVVVRFGNVLGSSGSAVPMFQEQLARGLPVTLTHPEVRRHFMTLDEAAQLVLLAGGIEGPGGTYVLGNEDSLPIIDVVHSLAFVMAIPHDKLEIRICGLRPGERLEEQLFYEDETKQSTDNLLVTRAARPPHPLDEVRSWLAELKHAAATDADTAAQCLMAIASADSAPAADKGATAGHAGAAYPGDAASPLPRVDDAAVLGRPAVGGAR